MVERSERAEETPAGDEVAANGTHARDGDLPLIEDLRVAPAVDEPTAQAHHGGDPDPERHHASAGNQGRSDHANGTESLPAMLSIATRPQPSTGEPNFRIDAPTKRHEDIYEWEILIEAPFAFDFFKLVRSLFRIPAPLAREGAGDGATTSRKRFYLRVALYNLGRLALIIGMIPFAMLAFSYVATLPFLVLRALAAWVGMRAATAVAGLGLLVTLSIPVLIILSWFRPTAYREVYKRSKVETFNILWALALFLASSMLEFLIASPVLPLRKDYTGSLDSTPQWTLYFADKSMNVLFANLPHRLFGPISDIQIREGGSEVSLGLLRLLLIFGFVALVRMIVLKLCVSKKELFYGTVGELRAYLDYCGKAEARNIRKVVPIHDDEIIEVRTRVRSRGREAPPPTADA